MERNTESNMNMREINEKIVVFHNGRDIEFLTRNESGYDVAITDRIVIREIFGENVYQVFDNDIMDTGIVIDIGANIGAFTMYAELLGAKVFSYEPDPQNFDILKMNIANNKFNAVLHQKGVYNERGSFELWPGQGASFIVGNKTESPSVKENLESGKVKTSTIETVTLEDVYIENKIVYCDILKIDVEGSEYKILEAHPDVIAKAKYITMEFHHTDEITFGKMISKLSLTHNIHIIGRYNNGGQVYAKRY